MANSGAGIKLPFKGRYPESLDRLWTFSFYNYAVVFNFERPFNNDAAKAALAQAKIEYEQQRMRYRDLISSIVVDVQSSLDGLKRQLQVRAGFQDRHRVCGRVAAR